MQEIVKDMYITYWNHINSNMILIIVPINVPIKASFALFIACKEIVRGDWI